ncbi:hypothetical protein [Algicola sagamiensis]|uniref:hypothetical protein n=1 Tax=Algicola sagamiensis TaxID=163869 RepID=UPI0012FAB4BB|nr:hypothetical protein [Algicola sagamiensis]
MKAFCLFSLWIGLFFSQTVKALSCHQEMKPRYQVNTVQLERLLKGSKKFKSLPKLVLDYGKGRYLFPIEWAEGGRHHIGLWFANVNHGFMTRLAKGSQNIQCSIVQDDEVLLITQLSTEHQGVGYEGFYVSIVKDDKMVLHEKKLLKTGFSTEPGVNHTRCPSNRRKILKASKVELIEFDMEKRMTIHMELWQQDCFSRHAQRVSKRWEVDGKHVSPATTAVAHSYSEQPNPEHPNTERTFNRS